MDSMFEILMGLPLFRGVTHERMSQIVGSAKFHFLKYPAGEEIAHTGEQCTHLKFILSGSARLRIDSADGRFRVGQTLTAPAVVSPDFLFGSDTTYHGTATALDTVSVLQVSKSDYLNILTADQVFLLNYLNDLSANAQRGVNGVLALAGGSIEERIAYWIICLTQPGTTDITLTCKQRDLYSVFGVQRSSFMAALDGMRERGLITYTSTEISIIDRKAMQRLLHI